MSGCRCNERQKGKTDGSTLLTYTIRVEGRGEGVNPTLLSYTLKYISLVDVVIK